MRVLFLNEREILKELNGRLSYREKAIWTRSYFQDSGNNTSLSEFSGKKSTVLDRNLQHQNAFWPRAGFWGLGLLLENTASLKIDSQ